jgi:hypothetical protein
MGLLRIMDATGDTTLEWSMSDPVMTARAEEVFDHQLHVRGRVPFARCRGEAANRARPIAAFDPTVEEIVFAAPVMGG